MHAISDAFKDKLINGGRVAVKAEVLDNGIPVFEFSMVSGNVTVNRNDPIRRRASVTLTDSDGTLTPEDASSLFSPMGNEIRLWRGYELNSGDTELLPVFTGGMSVVNIDDTPDGVTIALDCYDRARRVQRSKFISPYVVPINTNFSTAISQLVASRITLRPDELAFSSTAYATPKLVFGLDEERNPWAAAQDMALAIGYELFFDGMGVLNLRAIPDTTTSPVVWQYEEGENATIVGIQKALSDEEVFNHVIVVAKSSSSTGGAVRVEAKDTNPASPTYYLGDFGDVSFQWNTAAILTVEQATDVAKAMLSVFLGQTEQIRFTAIPNPAHQEDDVVLVRRGRSKVDSYYVFEEFNIPMGAGELMSVTTKKRRVL